MMPDAHLFFLQIHISSFGTGQWGEMAVAFLSMVGIGRLSMG
jgi:hypothetical protein